jgi:8-oxo-dGTP diphosphatase
MERESRSLPYTICFCKIDDQVLMLHRAKSPNKNKWNGLGGKIEEGEIPSDANIREILEEAEIDLNKAKSIHFGGLVTWKVENDDQDIYEGGMYAYVAELEDKDLLFEIRETREGTLEWKPLSWVLAEDNNELVNNIPHFLPRMINQEEPQEYHFSYKNGELIDIEVRELE